MLRTAVRDNAKSTLTTLQALRAIAALLVVLFHAGGLSLRKLEQPYLGDFFSFGHAGVDLFFVLSGFIIFYIHRRDFGRPARFRTFITKRLIRIYPIYWAIMAVVVPVYFMMPEFGFGYETQPDVILKSMLLIPQDHFPIIGQAWSLSHEMWFYLLFALGIMIGLRRALSLYIPILVGSIIVWILLITHHGRTEMPLALRFTLSPYNIEFLMGCAVAYLVLSRPLCPAPLAWILLVAGSIGFLTAGHFDAELRTTFGSEHLVLTYGPSSVCIIYGLTALEQRDCLRSPCWLAFLGDASYSIYLSHTLFLSLGMKLALRFGGVDALGTIAVNSLLVIVAVAGGAVCYQTIEAPLLRWLRRAFLKPRPTIVSMEAQPVVSHD